MGTIGLVAAATRTGLCSNAREKFEFLLEAGFRADPQLINDVLRDLGEPELTRDT